MNAEPQSIAAPRSPRPFSEMPGLWLQLVNMTESFFAGEIVHAGALNTALSVAVYTVVATACSVLVALLRPAQASRETFLLMGPIIAFTVCFDLLGLPIVFYFRSGLLYASAMIFGGKGKFTDQAYLYSLYATPLTLIASVVVFLTLIPRYGFYMELVIVLGLTVSEIVLDIRSFKVVHSFGAGRAAAAVLAPLALLLVVVLASVCVIGALMLMGPMIGNTFSSINQSLMTPPP